MIRLVVLLVLALLGATAGKEGEVSASPPCPYSAAPYPVGPTRKSVATLTVPRLKLRTPVFAGSIPDMNTEASRSLMHGPAFYPMYMPYTRRLTNSWPGQGGTVGMAGHRTTRTHPFCLVARLRLGDMAKIRMHRGSYRGTFIYQLVAKVRLSGNDWSAFAHPGRYDRHPRAWGKGIKREYLVTGACDPPHNAVFRVNDVWKLVAEGP